jgi:hypothetical protein
MLYKQATVENDQSCSLRTKLSERTYPQKFGHVSSKSPLLDMNMMDDRNFLNTDDYSYVTCDIVVGTFFGDLS